MKLRSNVLRLLGVLPAVMASSLYIEWVHAVPAGDPVAGEDVFASECSDCHSVRKGKNKKGPSLFGVIGRHSASIANYKYSDAMRSYNVIWTPDKIDAYITNPKKVLPGGKMKKYDGLPNAKERADLLAYLATKK
jgi:cytochrome c